MTGGDGSIPQTPFRRESDGPSGPAPCLRCRNDARRVIPSPGRGSTPTHPAHHAMLPLIPQLFMLFRSADVAVLRTHFSVHA